ncbi:OBSCN protein, partial [Atractosteus spatula]|nr:OBSCN protein [Atractosteus spatula]
MDVFGGAPRFLAYPRPVVVQCGTDAVLKCQIGGDPRPAVIWERNNEQIQPEGRYRLFEDGNVYNLIISRVDAEDSGQYICKAKNSIGETYAAATLKVEGEAQQRELQEENKPRFLIKPLSTRVGRGEDAVFSCKLWGKPRPEVIWEKDGKKLNEIFESTHYSVSYQDGGWFQLKLFKTRAPDGGVYTCRARNEYGEELAGAVLLVDAGPGHEEEATRNGYANGHWKPHQGKQRGGRQIAIRQKEDPVPNSAKVKMFAVTEGKHAKFRCYVTGKPKPEIVWRKDGRLILSGRRYLLYEDREGYFTLKVLYCKQEDNGLYVCAASNTAGQTLSAVHLTVKEPPVRFKQPLSDLEVWERDLAVLECEVPEDSVPTTWYLEDRRLQPGAKYGMEEWGTMRRLTIRDVGADDDGIYLCEMADGGRSIAEVSVRGTIVRKLPRKVDVLEEENAAFCVEVEEEEMDIHWYKDGIELRETHKTIIKSFGKTHILVFVNASPEDSGVVTFLVGRSKTSSQLRVRAARHSPPSSPVGVQMNTERANAALLSWVSAHDSRKNPPSGYVLERQELSSPEWLQCLTTDSATAVEILGDSVPCEADYRFRICSVNKYGRSGHVEFPGSVHLVPVARIQTPLQDALVMEGQDAEFSIELSACVVGTWFLNGTQIQEGERFSMHRSRTHHSLCIRCAQNTDNRTEITFIAYGVRDSAALYIQAPQVKFLPLPEMDCKKTVEAGSPLVLYCELSDPTAMVHWYKDGVELHTIEGLHIQSEGTMRRLVIQSAEFTHSGVYSCDAIDDVMRFHVEVKAPPVRFRALPEAERIKSIEAGCPIALQCELSDPNAQVCWYKDGVKLLPHSGIDIQSEGNVRRLVIQSADLHHSGVYRCETDNDAIHFKMDIKESERDKSTEAGFPIVLHCEVSDPTAQVCWYKDGTKLLPQSDINIQSEGTTRRMIIQSAELAHSGVYSCDAVDDVIKFTVKVKAPPVRFTALPESERDKSTEAGFPIVLHCEVSDPTAQVCWYKDGTKLLPQSDINIQSEGTTRRMIIQSAELAHSGVYSCDAVDDVIKFTVKVKAPPVRFTALPESERDKSTEAGFPIVLHCEVSDPTAQVCWYKDGTKLLPQSDINIQSEGTTRRMIIQSAELAHSGVYSCDAVDDVIKFTVKVKVRFTALPESERDKSTEAGCPIVLHCKVSDPTAQVCWYKDGTKLLPQSDINIQSEGTTRRMIIQSAELAHSGVYSCDSVDDVMKFKVDVKGDLNYNLLNSTIHNLSAIIFIKMPEVVYSILVFHVKCNCYLHNNFLPFSLSYLPVPFSSLPTSFSGSGQISNSLYLWLQHMYAILFLPLSPVLLVTVHCRSPWSLTPTLPREQVCMEPVCIGLGLPPPPVRFTALPDSERSKSIEAGCPIVLHCEVSDPTAQVCWYKDGTKLLPQSSIDIQSEGTTRRMIIQSAELAHSGVYSCDAVDDVMKFKVDVKAPPVRFTALPESERNKSTEAGCPIVLHCEVSDPTAQVCWYKDGTKLLPQSGIDIQSEGTTRRMIIQSAELAHSGVYSCDAVDDVIKFTVKVKGFPIVLHCEVSDPTAQVCWYKDGTKLLPQSGIDIQSEGTTRRMIIQSAELAHSGVYSCDAVDDVIKFTVKVKAPPVRFTALPESERNKSTEAGCPIVLHCKVSDPTAQVCWYKDGTKLLPQSDIDIQSESTPPVRFRDLDGVERNKSIEAGCPVTLYCEISDPTAQVCWYKDGSELLPQDGIDIQSEGCMRKLIIQSAEMAHSGVYSCNSIDDAIHFNVDVKAPPVRFTTPESERDKSTEAGCPIVLHCEVSDPTAQVCWYKDGTKLLPQSGIDIQSEGTTRRMIIQSADLAHSGVYSCDAVEDVIKFKVDVEAPPVKFTALPEAEMHKSIEAGCPIVLHCELSDPTAQVSWYKDGTKLLPHSGIDIQSEGNLRRLIIQSAQFSRSGVYSCKTADDVREFYVDVKAPPVKFIEVHEEDLHKSVVESELVVLYCELSRPDVDAHWYKDGVEIKPSDNISVQSDGTMRRLIIQSTNLSDSGMYTCRAGDSALIFKVNVREPPVTIVHPREDVHLERHVSEEIVLSCELSRSNSAVHWYKDGQELQETQNIKFKSEGPYRRLVILNSSTEDTGEYVCDTADDSIFFQVTVTEPAVHIVSPSQSPLELNHRTCERLVLSCEVSRSNAIVRWYRDGLEVEENDNLILEIEGVHRRLIIPKTTILDSAEYVCDAVDDSLTFLVKISEPPVKFVHPQKAAGTMKGFVGEPVTLECEVSRSNAVVCWKKEGVEIEESRGISIIEDGVLRQLLIHSASLEDAGNYICDAKEDVMNFKVKINEPPVKILRKGELKMQQEFLVSDDIVLECELSRANGSVKWYKDGEKIADNDRLCMEEEGAFRSLVILNAEISDSGEYFCDARDDNVVFHVIVKEPPVSIVGNSDNPEHHSLIAGDDLVLMCEVSRPNAVVLWYCNGKLLSADYRTRIDSQGTKRQLVISDLQTSDTGKYICDATDDKMVTMVTVQEPPIKFVNKEDAKDSIEVVENESITLCAKVSLENAVVQWLKNWRDISGEHYNTSSDGKCRLFSIHHAQISDSGVYTCDAFTDEMHFTLQVKAAPVKFERKQEKAEEVFSMEGQNTVMSAVVSSGKSEVKWFRHRCQIFEAEKYEARVEGRVHSLIVKNTCKEDCGLYTCVSNDDEMVFVVSVKEMKLNFVRMLEDVCAHKDDTITLRCELCKPKGDVQWLKDGQEIIPSRRLVIKAEGRERSLTIYRATGNDSGEYVCESKDDRTCAKVMVEMPRVVEFIAEVHNVTVLEGEDAMFKCVVSPEDAELVWHRNGEPIIPDDKYIVSNNGVCHTLHILSCQLSDSCKVTAEAEGVVSKANLKVQEAQVVFTKKMEAVMAEEHGEATLEVEVSLDSGEVQWMRQGVVIQPGPKFTLRQNGKKRSLTVHNLSFSDRGTYRCETLHDRTQGKLIVESRNISIRKGLSDIETYERETASFEVELSHTDVEGVWQKDGIRLKPNNHWRVSNHGRVHSLTFSNLTLEDSGTVTFCAESVRTSARLTVKEPPVTFLKKLEDLRIPENTAALLECELSRQNVEVKWLKNGQELKPGKSYRIYSMGRKRFLQITKCRTMDSGIYTCDAGDSTVSCTLDIYEREVEIVQGLEDLDIEEDQNAVFLCEVSVEDVPGEWFKNGEKIKPTSTIKIRQEGTKHFLLMCNVRAEDSGEIKFVAKQAESTAYLEVEELPVTIVKPLRDKTALEKHRVILECTVSNPRSSIRWYQGDKLILPSEHFEICSEGCYRKLVIHQVALSDEGIYSVEVGEHKSSARLMVEEQAILIVRVLEDVEVRAPEEACFECEISVPVIKPPVWTLNGETLQHGGDVRLESMGTVHRLTLRKTTTEMTGLVKFTTGKARSSARLKVKGE